MFTEFLNANPHLSGEVAEIARVAGYLWQKGWAEGSTGSISVNLSILLGKQCPVIKEAAVFDPGEAFPLLGGDLVYVTGKGARMRDVARDPLEQGCLVRVDGDGRLCRVMSAQGVEPDQEFLSHLAIQQFLKSRGDGQAAVLHTHPAGLIALTHHRPFLEGDELNRMLWAMTPVTRMFVPHGAGLVPYTLPGSLELTRATISILVNHDVVLWEKHGALAVGRTAEECFDTLDILDKSAQICLTVRSAGFTPGGSGEE